MVPEFGYCFNRYSSILTLPASLIGAYIFSESLWQRVWASQDTKTLVKGASIATVLVAIAVFVTGFCGFLAAWAGLIDENTNPNLYMFQVWCNA